MLSCLLKPSRLALNFSRLVCLLVCLIPMYLNVSGMVQIVALLYVYRVYRQLLLPRIYLDRPDSVRQLRCVLNEAGEPVTRVAFKSGEWVEVQVLGVDWAGFTTLTCLNPIKAGSARMFKLRIWPDALSVSARALFNTWVRLVWVPKLMHKDCG